MVVLFALVGCRNRDVVEPSIKPDSDRVIVGYEAQDVEIGVDSNVDISVDVLSEWATLISVDKGKRCIIRVRVEENFEREPRNAKVVILSGAISQTVMIIQEKSPRRMNLTIGHSCKSLKAPTWEGEDVSGTIDWGDGRNEEYREGLSHSYDSEGEHKATFDMLGPTSFKLDELEDINSLDISYL